MKKLLLASSILLVAAGCSAQERGLGDVQQEAISQRASLIGMELISNKTYMTREYRWDPAAHTTVPVDVEVRLHLKFIPASGYEVDDQYHNESGPMAYEVLVSEVAEETGEVFTRDHTYFARATGDDGIKHEIYNCDSSRSCHTNMNHATMFIYDDVTTGRKALRLKQDDDFKLLFGSTEGEIYFAAKASTPG